MLLQESGQNPPPQTTTSPPPSATSSPTHDFSFTVSFHPIPNPPPPSSPQHPNSSNTYNHNNHKTNNNTISNLPLAAIDLSPADDIFFHGHLLPLHHLPLSPRSSSTNSMDSFTLPIQDLLYDHHHSTIGNTSFHCHHQTTFSEFNQLPPHNHTQNRVKSKPFSLFGIPKWKKRCDDERERDDEEQSRERNNTKKKLKLDLGQLIKRYMKMVRPLLSFQKSSKRSNNNTKTFKNHQSYSFSGNSFRKAPEMMTSKRRGMFSAPASMKTSPANSGILVANSGTVSPAKSTTSESSTMEELHAAIQAAIAHCKNSIAMEDKLQSHN